MNSYNGYFNVPEESGYSRSAYLAGNAGIAGNPTNASDAFNGSIADVAAYAALAGDSYIDIIASIDGNASKKPLADSSGICNAANQTRPPRVRHRRDRRHKAARLEILIGSWSHAEDRRGQP